MSKLLRFLFLVYAVVAAVVGAALLVAPGRVLGWFGWEPIDPLLSRVLGAALLGLAWGSLRGSMAGRWSQVRILLEAQAWFHILACAGLLRHLLKANYSFLVWGPFAVLAAFGLIWILALLLGGRGRRARD